MREREMGESRRNIIEALIAATLIDSEANQLARIIMNKQGVPCSQRDRRNVVNPKGCIAGQAARVKLSS
jgi:hypothetical protein